MNRARVVTSGVGLIALVVPALLALAAGPAGAAGPGCQAGDIEVTSAADTGANTLRAAFATASGLAGPQRICVDTTVVGPINLTSGGLLYNAGTTPGLTVEGNGITVAGNNTQRIISNVVAGPLTLDHITIVGGNDGTATNGGGVFSTGALTVTNSTISGNTEGGGGAGGGLFGNTTVTVTSSTVSGNTDGTGGGGGIFANGTVTLTNSTISGNTTSGSGGGGVFASGGGTFTNSTISGNSANVVGGGVFANSGGTTPLTFVYTTVVNNTAPTGANVDGNGTTPFASFGSVVALPQGGGANCAALNGVTSHGFNLEDDVAASCGFAVATSDLAPGTAPNLGALANNGGPTQTRLPQPGSPLLDAIPTASCQADGASGVTTDQRGVARPQGAGCDVGAVEVAVTTPAAPVAVTPRFTG